MHLKKRQLYQLKILGIMKVNPKVVYITILQTIFDQIQLERFNSKGEACILNWDFGKESWRVSTVAFTYTNKPPPL